MLLPWTILPANHPANNDDNGYPLLHHHQSTTLMMQQMVDLPQDQQAEADTEGIAAQIIYNYNLGNTDARADPPGNELSKADKCWTLSMDTMSRTMMVAN